MTINDEILFNQYGQNLVDVRSFQLKFNYFNLDEKRNYLKYLLFLIGQSKSLESDIPTVILNSKLRPTFTPCVLLKKGVKYHNLMNIVELPENELDKSLILFLNLFRIAYQRRLEIEKADGDKWWYSDLSDDENVRVIINQHS
ncbi:DUF5958 family protein [Flavobacterium sp. DG1-102-2]|uniref:DUF5958 family protein n=1 Tax=Flavobacterium sp. DG1-102-2 TaxID=3081663 RepID=UPI00294A0033|nr:DUF5958 family protein [Flavobacterium sp. DG1-102-2]MDV6168943.1 DUF5958 family protein [Flavobacterium sp. DG1-102-2]